MPMIGRSRRGVYPGATGQRDSPVRVGTLLEGIEMNDDHKAAMAVVAKVRSHAAAGAR